MKQVAKLNISEFLSVSTQLAIQAAHIINDVFSSNDLQKQMKGEDDPMTLADVKAQTLIIKGLKSYWPTLNIIGEESSTYDGELNLDFLNPKLFPQAIFKKSRDNQDLCEEIEITDDVVVWVDPLDGTLSYVNNELDAVTTLIGLSVGRHPVLGIIGKPYSDHLDAQGHHIFQPLVYFGNTAQSKVFYVSEKDIQASKENIIPFELVRPIIQDKSQYTFCTSKNRLMKDNEDKIRSLSTAELTKVGGAGKKILLVLLGDCDFFIFIGTKTKRWDTCSGDALLRCFGGAVYGLDGSTYNYNPTQINDVEYLNERGLLASVHSGNILQQFQIKSKGFL